MKTQKLIAAVFSALLLTPAAIHAQTVGTVIPKIEYSVGGGIGYGGYVTSFSGNPWMNSVFQDPDGPIHMDFFLPKGQMSLSGHVGAYVDFNFTDHWGLITGAEFGYYCTSITSDNLLNVVTLDPTNAAISYAPARPATRAAALQYEVWVGANLENYKEAHRLYAIQIPIMAKYMTPISPLKGHQYYVAAGAKLGFRVFSVFEQSFDFGNYDAFAWRTYPITDNGGDVVYADGALEPAVFINPSTPYDGSAAKEFDGIGKAKSSLVDVMLSLDTGFRWNLGSGFGIYTGLYCDFGLIRAVARERGSKVLNYAPSSVKLDQYNAFVSADGAKLVPVLAADAPDYITITPDGENIFVKNDQPMSKLANAMQAGFKLRFSFGKAEKKPKVVRPPKEPKPKKVPNEIKQTMIELSDALFAFDKFDLNETSRALLDKVTDWLKDNPDLNVEIAGHTDDRGSDAYNQKLSENRAKAVYDYITSHGVDKSRLSYKGYGESQPIATNETDEGRQKNRRVELHIK